MRFFKLSQENTGLSEEEKAWAIDKCLKHIAYQTKSRTSCLDCGHEWPNIGTVNTCVCPKCNTKLKIEVTRKKKMEQREFVAHLDVVEGFQFVRLFELKSFHRSGKKADISVREVIHQFFTPDGIVEIVAKLHHLHWNLDSFGYEFGIRDKHQFHQKYDPDPINVLPGPNCLPIFKRNGFKGKLHGLTAFELFTAITHDPRAETLLKARQYKLLLIKAASTRRSMVDRYWDSIKICIRNKYKVKDALMWLDYMDLLKYFRKDLRNPKFVCPSNLKREHDRLVKKKRVEERRREVEAMRRYMEEEQAAYEKAKQAFFGIQFKAGHISVRVLEHVREFMEEGDIHKHCLFANKYFRKHDSLVMSATFKGNPIETIEISLSEMKVIQSRGLRNNPSEHHMKIVNLVNRNMNKIRDRRQKLDKTA
ncbi:PcfJ domain-containing protein [Parapedobacter indicus]|uniref:PcfJ-like protein n=1 Tax=Parapedobacter indicus TaxID=1477437 RepID=A0A1I3E1N5_9SPHI|nr:PcfJ domain-containing protein [Parapedobacter indicus]PPL04922.1 PcfJ-like protein [Parapedobacter indicus]SFH92601.1 PcfJ-like protein [Parapedobacter indicus]